MNIRRPVRTRELSAAARRTSRASTRCGAIAARSMADRSCSASSARPTPCTRRWWRGSTRTAEVGREALAYMGTYGAAGLGRMAQGSAGESWMSGGRSRLADGAVDAYVNI